MLSTTQTCCKLPTLDGATLQLTLHMQKSNLTDIERLVNSHLDIVKILRGRYDTCEMTVDAFTNVSFR
jgi:hypothetical protein